MARCGGDRMNAISTVSLAEFRRMQPAKRGKQPERDIKDAIRAYLQVHGWFVVYLLQGGTFQKHADGRRAGARSHPGITDMLALRGGEVWFIEVKQPGEKLRPEQEQFRRDIEDHSGKWMLATSVEDVEPLGLRDRKGCEHDS